MEPYRQQSCSGIHWSTVLSSLWCKAAFTLQEGSTWYTNSSCFLALGCRVQMLMIQNIGPIYEEPQNNIGLMLTRQADELSKINSWLDTSIEVHPNMRSHKGVVLSLGWRHEKCMGLINISGTKRKQPIRNLLIIYFNLTYWLKFYTCL